MQNDNMSPRNRFLRTFLLTIVIVVVFAYGFQVTKINLEEPKKEQRQSQLINVMRALARPDLTLYESDRLEIEAPILIPCPTTQFTLPDLSQPGPSIKLSQQCAESGSEVTITGTGFKPKEDVFIYFVPYTADTSQEVELKLANQAVPTDKQGDFSETIELRSGRTSDQPQKIRAIVIRRTGLPEPSQAVYETIDKIIETVFLALIATTFGTILSIPVSFLAARNLMIQVTSLFGGLVTLFVFAILGWFLGAWLFGIVGGWGVNLLVGGQVPAAAMLWIPALLLFSVQAMARGRGSQWVNTLRSYGLGVLGTLAVALIWGLVAGLGQILGTVLLDVLGPFGFLGNFIFVIADAMGVFIPLMGGLAGMFILASAAGLVTENLLHRAGETLLSKIFTVVMSILAGMMLFGLPAALIAWLYELSRSFSTIGVPAIIGGGLLGVLGLVFKPGYQVSTGMFVYYITRTILNILRAIEPLIMAIVFVVWVGIGPFAGVMALMLHTIAALGKLYSEQVESISQGPIEAVTATGANRLQTIVYAVIPQIVPPYIAFTIYRWDINVRMSTIFVFAGGGGIGFLLQQNLNLLKYRQASVQMIAIAIVVSSLDYISAKIRERIV
jgi:phosphonate ABC transporter permease subunit PhnE